MARGLPPAHWVVVRPISRATRPGAFRRAISSAFSRTCQSFTQYPPALNVSHRDLSMPSVCCEPAAVPCLTRALVQAREHVSGTGEALLGHSVRRTGTDGWGVADLLCDPRVGATDPLFQRDSCFPPRRIDL